MRVMISLDVHSSSPYNLVICPNTSPCSSTASSFQADDLLMSNHSRKTSSALSRYKVVYSGAALDQYTARPALEQHDQPFSSFKKPGRRSSGSASRADKARIACCSSVLFVVCSWRGSSSGTSSTIAMLREREESERRGCMYIVERVYRAVHHITRLTKGSP